MADGRRSAPHSLGEQALVFAHHIAIRRGRTKRCMAQPALDQMGWHQRLECGYPEGMAKTFWASCQAGDFGEGHHFLDPPPSGATAPAPNPAVSLKGNVLVFPDMKNLIQFKQQVRGERYLPDNSPLSSLEGHEIDGAGIEINGGRRHG